MTPIVYDSDEESYQGINADYLALMAHSLGLKVVIRQYDTEQQALAALADRQVDTLLTQVAHRDALAPGLTHTAPLIKTWPTLVTSLKSPAAADHRPPRHAGLHPRLRLFRYHSAGVSQRQNHPLR